MSSIQDSAMHIWTNGEDITQDRLEQNRKVFQTAINDNQSQINAQYTNAQIDAKVNTAASTTKVVQTGTVFPTTGLVDGQEFYRDDLHIMYTYDVALNKWVDRGSTALQGFRNLLDPSKQSFTRATNATRKDLTPVPFSVLRTEQGKFGQGVFIEEATTNIGYNTDFETITGTATVFSDAMTAGTTADPAWTVQSGSFTWSTSGATVGANGALLTAGNSNWKPLTGNNGTALSLTLQTTFTTPATLNTGDNGRVELFQSSGNYYSANISNTTLWLNKCIGGTITGLSSNAVTLAGSTTYTITLAITPSGGLTAKLYSGVGTGGTLLQTLTATDTSLIGGFLIGVGGDTGVIVKNAQVTAPFADGWTYGVDGSGPGSVALTTSSASGSYSVSIIQPSVAVADAYVESPHTNVNASTTYTVSAYVSAQTLAGTGLAGIRVVEWTSGGVVVQDNQQTANTSITSSSTNNYYQKVTFTFTTQSTTGYITVRLQVGTGGTVSGILSANFDCLQVEQKAYATSYIRNDSTSASITRNAEALTYTTAVSPAFGALFWKPEHPSSIGNQSRTLAYGIGAYDRYQVYFTSNARGGSAGNNFAFVKNPSSTSTYTWNYLNSPSISFNALDTIFVAWLDDPSGGYMHLWVGINGGTPNHYTLANTAVIADAINWYIGCAKTTGNEVSGTIDDPIITDIIPSLDQVQALYQASDWGGNRNHLIPSLTSTNVSSFRAYHSTPIALSAAVYTKIPYQTKVYDNQGEFDNVTNYRFTAKKAGIYLITAGITLSSQPDSNRLSVEIYKNGNDDTRVYDGVIGGASNGTGMGSAFMQLSAGDYIEIYGWSTNALNTIAQATNSFFEVIKLI